ncbi:hypothetical protein [Actinoplanes teichomyceticus]|uniref:Uncharacterized protein n=1 Tax=Actinoplanes teichomyceticus TaxID=1867 RepID=A0A561WAQ1_ACTTI|nr:hypothetical protein [Actinoplanes teichomyceticus]TWG20933.1 hypothetical protein FHX34_103462 [Actinoplanes teichomyceticus]GIF16520.1 hypothetical protein Ate01nite_65520 [Actinoplanes teichomyceticus]
MITYVVQWSLTTLDADLRGDPFMPMTQVAVVFVQPGPYDETFAYSAITYCRNRGIFPGYVIHGNWRAVEILLEERLVQAVIVARNEHRFDRRLGNGADTPRALPPHFNTRRYESAAAARAEVVDLAERRSWANTRRIPLPSRHPQKVRRWGEGPSGQLLTLLS